jgi:hypothetical protein
MESRMELFAQIRRDARVEGLSVRALAARHGVYRRTVRQALTSASPTERKPRQGVSRRLELGDRLQLRNALPVHTASSQNTLAPRRTLSLVALQNEHRSKE